MRSMGIALRAGVASGAQHDSNPLSLHVSAPLRQSVLSPGDRWRPDRTIQRAATRSGVIFTCAVRTSELRYTCSRSNLSTART